MAAKKAFDFNEEELIILGVVGIAVYVFLKGGLFNAGAAIGSGIINAATGAVTGTVDATGQIVGLPALADITTDPYVARYIMDHPNGGKLAASKYASAAAFAGALWLDEWSGHTPPAGSKIEQLFPPDAYTAGSW